MAGRTDWMVSFRRCETLIAARTANAVSCFAWPRSGALSKTSSLGDHHLARALRVVLEERLLVLEILFGRLHLAVGLGDPRDQRVRARRGAAPGIGEQLPPEL